ncbi:MAG: 2-oxoacid:acceptor oxidoreductase family protein, partial [Bacillota bacterium]|nr:2-oxoacid:acceptor oxidoreductase family protein [Bacillota bacterium]
KKPINSPVFQKADRLVAFNLPSLEKFRDKVEKGGIVLYNASLIKDPGVIPGATILAVPANDIAIELGNIQVANMVMLGAFLEVTGMFLDATIDHILQKLLGERKAHLMPINRSAIAAGRELAKNGASSHA